MRFLKQLTGHSATIILSVVLLLSACNKNESVRDVLANGRRVPVKAFNGTYFYQRSTTKVRFDADTPSNRKIVPGSYEVQDVLVHFVRSENTLDVVAIDPQYRNDQPALDTNILASFSIKNVDVVRKKNDENQDTLIQEETDSQNRWQDREFMVIDATEDSLDRYKSQTQIAINPDSIEMDLGRGSINIPVTRQLKDGSTLNIRYSFLKYEPSKTYVQKEYPLDLQNRFGFFKVSTYQFDKYGQITQSNRKEFISRWDTSKPVVYYLSSNFPDRLKPLAHKVFDNWNKVFRSAVGKDVLELRENTGQELGDLRYSLIAYDDTVDANHGVLGYGPTYRNPRTGELIKGDVILYGGVLNKAIYRERIWQALLRPNKSEVGLAMTEDIFQKLLKSLSSPTGQSPRTHTFIEKADVERSLHPEEVLADTSHFANGRELLEKVKSEPSLLDVQKSFQDEGKKLEHQNMTEMNEAFGLAISNAVEKKQLSDDELEALMFMPLLTHELGHNLGLRHNFMASADSRHYGPGNLYSSVMDYGFLSSEEPPAPGEYDGAAIRVAYNDSVGVVEKEIAENYYFCTDEDTNSSTNAMCNQFDTGSTLSDVVKSQVDRYKASYHFNNQRLDRVQFDYTAETNAAYNSKLIQLLLPIRNMYDHSVAILAATNPSRLKKDATALWKLARQRVEADPSSDPQNIVTIGIFAGTTLKSVNGINEQENLSLERKIDLAKVKALQVDALQAKQFSYQSLAEIILDNERDDYASADLIRGDLQTRGVLQDKFYALKFLTARTRNPLSGGGYTTVAGTLGYDGIEDLVRTLISGVAYVPEKENSSVLVPQQVDFDMNLRQLAIHLLVDELSLPGGSAHTRKIIAIEKLPKDGTNPTFKLSEMHFNQIKEVYKKIYRGGMKPEQSAQIGLLLNQELNARDAEEETVFHVPFAGSQYYTAPLMIPNVGVKTATGDLIRYSLNAFSVMHAAVMDIMNEKDDLIKLELGKPKAEQNSDVIAEAESTVNQMERMRQALAERVEQEETLLDQIARLYNPS